MSVVAYIALGAAIVLMLSTLVVPNLRARPYLMMGGLVAVGSVIVYRWALSGHPPMLGTFEETLMASFTLIVASLALGSGKVFTRPLAAMAAFFLAYGLFFDTQIRPLVISEQSLLVYFHVLFAWVGYGLYTVCFLAALYVINCEACGKDRLIRWALDRGLLYGVSAQSVSFFIGAYYSSRLHGSWWVWDTVEYLFLISWLLYGVALHGRVLLGWRDRAVAGWVVAGFLATLVLYWGLVYMPWATYHVFDMEVKVHLPLGGM